MPINEKGVIESPLVISENIWKISLYFGIPNCTILGLAYLYLGLPITAIIMLSTAVFWTLSLIFYSLVRTGIETIGFTAQIYCVLAATVGMALLGGVIRSGGVVFFGLIGPIYALAFPKVKRA